MTLSEVRTRCARIEEIDCILRDLSAAPSFFIAVGAPGSDRIARYLSSPQLTKLAQTHLDSAIVEQRKGLELEAQRLKESLGIDAD